MTNSQFDRLTLDDLEIREDFIRRHIGPGQSQIREMLTTLGYPSIEALLQATVPASIRLDEPLNLPPATRERRTLSDLRRISERNEVFTTMIGMGYYGTRVPAVIQRNILENPAWYTAYTPYQPEISQGTLQTLFEFQTQVARLTGMDIANASMYDGSTACAEAVLMAARVTKRSRAVLSGNLHPHYAEATRTLARYMNIDIAANAPVPGGLDDVISQIDGETACVVVQNPDVFGNIHDLRPIAEAAHAKGALLIAVFTEIVSLGLIESPGAMGADIVVGEGQSIGVGLQFGGPYVGLFACRNDKSFIRNMPGRLAGETVDADGRRGYVLTLSTREQHIRREKANSNICTAQVLLANMASFYAVYHGPQGLRRIANRIHRLTDIVALGLKDKGVEIQNGHWFDTLTFEMKDNAADVLARSKAAQLNLRNDGEGVFGVSLDEAKTRDDVEALFTVLFGENHGLDIDVLDSRVASGDVESIPAALVRQSDFLTHPVFNEYHSETEMLRYIKKLENKDLALNHSMISLGSCTMKLNATAEMIPVTWPEFGQLHPFCPVDQAQGYAELVSTLSDWLIDITGYDALSMQPNSGAQGEYAGLLAIQKYHESRGDGHRDICLIPSSAHGTNPASAQMMNMKVVVVDCDKHGNVDMADLKAKAEEAGDNLSCIMVTYPSTHGVYEEGIREICDLVHSYGGQVYMDGANMNAQVGVTSPGYIGSDVSHLNLHKTFCIPHGGGGPGMGPIGVKEHLKDFLPNHSVINIESTKTGNGAVSGAQFGSASILPISWMYIAMMGGRGLREASEVAIMNANYVAEQLSKHFKILYRGRNNRVAHECIIDLRPLKEAAGIAEIDVAKRLQDYGFHSPTMSFPVAGTIMVEPTESESKAELDRFIEAMVSIKQEADKIAAGDWPKGNNPLVNAPHTLADITDAEWDRPYDRQTATYPVEAVGYDKFWPTVNRIDDVFGDRNLMCSCPSIDEYR
ncbi:MAG TPA: glycine dehydrogenase (aminomethyl-transferring) [Rhodospirillaceae bacterium]|nr:glycine dehydrogenase (aminomethyl-transferring) [Rhodospirillaceae bacterium]